MRRPRWEEAVVLSTVGKTPRVFWATEFYFILKFAMVDVRRRGFRKASCVTGKLPRRLFSALWRRHSAGYSSFASTFFPDLLLFCTAVQPRATGLQRGGCYYGGGSWARSSGRVEVRLEWSPRGPKWVESNRLCFTRCDARGGFSSLLGCFIQLANFRTVFTDLVAWYIIYQYKTSETKL